MGELTATYGLLNLTKNERISTNWKKPVSNFELKQIAIILNWDLNKDIIYCGCYYLLYKYKNKNNTWQHITNITSKINNDNILNYTIKYVCNGHSLEIIKNKNNNIIIL
jgi:hypothetical protein